MCIFYSHLIFIVCVSLLSQAYDTKTNSLYAQAYSAINALSDSDSDSITVISIVA